MTSQDQHVRERVRRLRATGLSGAFALAALAGLLWLGADVQGTKECLEGSYGLPADRMGMTREGDCLVTVPGPYGPVTTVLPTISEPIATAALIAGLACAVPPGICLWLATRRPR